MCLAPLVGDVEVDGQKRTEPGGPLFEPKL